MRQIDIAKNKGKNIAIGVLVLLVLGMLVYISLANGLLWGAGDIQATGGITLRIDDSAVPAGQMPEDLNPGAEGIKIPGYGSITIPAGKTDVSLSLLNPEGNPCYFTFELVLDDTGETLYTSELVEPSKAIEQVTLNRALEQGEYDLTLQIRTYELDGLTAMNNANVRTVLKVV